MTGSGPTASEELVGGKGQLSPCLCIHPEVTPLHYPFHTCARARARAHTVWFPEHRSLKKAPFILPTSGVSGPLAYLSKGDFSLHHGEFSPFGFIWSSRGLWGLTGSTPTHHLHEIIYSHPMRMDSVLSSTPVSCSPRGFEPDRKLCHAR